ncbi:sodium:calcium antiporter [Geojedonia litorea]|uniref:Sodium:calcium antiporter n=1 Tax=Geojedonia litorea TaxID=1268269 RepID=A0ABV9MYA9_9FLAO
MEIIFDVLIVIATILLITKGAMWLVDSAVAIAHKIGISELVIGLTIVGFGTSAPEFAVTIISAINGQSDISVGNIVGSNIFNLGFILGGTAIIKSLSTSKKIVYRDGGVLLFGTVMLIVFLWDLVLSTFEGVLLFSFLIVYIGALLFKKEIKEEDDSVSTYKWYSPFILLFSLVLVVGSSHFLVDSASALARIMGVSDWIIGVTIVAAGTSAPELATSIVAALRGKYGISIGNLIGSDIFNMFGVLGVASMIQNLEVDLSARIDLVLLFFMVILALVFMRTGWKITRLEGILLVLIGLSRWIYSFMF